MTRGSRAGGIGSASTRVLLAVALVAAMVAVNEVPGPHRATAEPGGAEAGALVPLVPTRLLETRSVPGATTDDGLFQGIGRVEAGSTTEFVVAGRGGVAADADAALLNVTAVLPEAPGFLTVWPCGTARPAPASHVNFFPGGVYPNAVLTGIGGGGKVCVFASAGTDVIADVNAFVPAGGSLVPVAPARLLETRDGPGAVTTDARFEGGGVIGAGETLDVEIAGRGGVPVGASAVLLNVTAVVPSAPGFLTVYPCDQARPQPASSVNYFDGGVYPNAVLAKLTADGRVCIYSSAASHALVDVAGYVEFGSNLATSNPLRMLETRVGSNAVTFDGEFAGIGALDAGETVELQVAGRGGVPNSATAAMMNVAAVFPERAGFLTVYPCDEDRPDPASNVNYFPGGVYPNAVMAQLSADGKVCIYSSAPTDVIADIAGSLGTNGTGLDLSAISLAITEAEPLDRLPIKGLDLTADLSEFTVELHLPGGERQPIFVFADDDGPFVRAPLHPVDPLAPGQIQLSIVDGDRVGHTATIDLSALPQAPGAWAELIGAVTADLAATALAAGSSIAEIRATSTADLSPDLATVKLIDAALAAGTDLPTSLDDLPAEGRLLLEAIVAKAGLADAIADSSVGATPEAFGSGARLVGAEVTDAATPNGFAGGARRLVESTELGCRDSHVEIPDVPALADALAEGVEYWQEVNGAQAQVWQLFADTAGYAQYIPGRFGDWADHIGKVISAVALRDAVQAISYPNQLSLDVEGTSQFNEDFINEGHLTKADVTATAPGGSVADVVATIAAELVGALADNVLGDLVELGVENSGLIGQFAERATVNQYKDAIVASVLADLGAVPAICETSWTRSALDEKYVLLESGLGGLDIDSLGYEPNRVGFDYVRATLKSAEFSNFSASDTQNVETKRLAVILDPGAYTAFVPGEQFELTATIVNADNTVLWWTDPHGPEVNTNGSATLQFTSAPSITDYEYTIEVESASRTGLFADADEGVKAIATIKLSDVRVLPNGETVAPGGTIDFVAQNHDGEELDVIWDATGGSIGEDGVYTAGPTPGDYTVTARMRLTPDRVGQAGLTIADENCDIYGTWNLDIARWVGDINAYWDDLIPTNDFATTYVVGTEQVTFTPAAPGEVVETYHLFADSTLRWEDSDTIIVEETRGTDDGDFYLESAPDRVWYVSDVDLIESQGTYTDKSTGNVSVLPWAPDHPLSSVGDVFQVEYTCELGELVMHDGPVDTYWSPVP